MSEYRVEQVLLDDDTVRQATALINASFPENPEIDERRIVVNTTVPGGGASLYMAAKIGDEIIGFNAFIAHSLWLNGEKITAYQSCWTATSAVHRGKGIFQNLISAGRDAATAARGAFIFGFPNTNSHPLFVGKLGFREVGSLRWRMPLIPVLRRQWLACASAADRTDAVLQDEEELIALKRIAHGDALLDLREGASRIWGVQRTSSRGGLKLFEIGGLALQQDRDFAPLLRRLYRPLRGSVAMQFVGVEGGGYDGLFRQFSPAFPPMIIDDLTLDSRRLKFNFFSGVRDYF